jgi:hypothetical protein
MFIVAPLHFIVPTADLCRSVEPVLLCQLASGLRLCNKDTDPFQNDMGRPQLRSGHFNCNKLYQLKFIMSRPTKSVRRLIDWNAVGGRLRELRGFHVTQAEFAKRIGVSQGYYSLAERGQREIGPEILLRMSHEVGKSIEWLLTGKSSTAKE